MPKGNAVSDEDYAPYAPYAAVHEVIQRYRDRGLADPITTAHLETIGIAPSMTPRTLRALRFLGLVDEGGNRLEAFERLKRASSDEYPAQLAEVVRAAYMPIFTIVDPAQDSDTAVADAFRRYEPSAQRDKMIALFRGLAQEAGIVPSERATVARIPRPRPESRPRAATARTPQTATPKPATDHVVDTQDDGQSIDYRLITAVIQQLPKDGHWTNRRRDRWLATLTSAVDLLFTVDEETSAQG
jgi:hypothetical protein